MNHLTFPRIDTVATGQRIALLMHEKGCSVKDIQAYLGLSAPQAIYKWLRGNGLPNTDNLLALSRLFSVSIDDLLVAGGDDNKDNSPYFSMCSAPLLKASALTYYHLRVA